MLTLKSVICILTFILIFVGTTDLFNLSEKLQIFFKVIGIVLGVIFCLLLERNWYIIPKIILFFTICSCIWSQNKTYSKEEIRSVIPTAWCHIGVGVCFAFTAFLFSDDMYWENFEEYEEISSTKSCTLICASDTSSITGNIHGDRYYVYGPISGTFGYDYNYYYMSEDGGIKLGTIPAEDTTIYYIESDEEPYLETIVTTKYEINNNNNPPTREKLGETATYNLFIPEGSITNEYKFDAE